MWVNKIYVYMILGLQAKYVGAALFCVCCYDLQRVHISYFCGIRKRTIAQLMYSGQGFGGKWV